MIRRRHDPAEPAVCIRCGGSEDLMDRGMAPGMTYCAPCRAAMNATELPLSASPEAPDATN